MAKVRLNGDSSGFIELAAPNAAGSNTLTLPTSNGSANQLLKNSGTAGTLAWSTLTEDSSGNLNVDSGTLFVDATNNRVGIGTTSPADALHVVGKIAVTGTNPSIRQTVQTANLDLCGGTTVGTDPAIQLFGSSSPSDANHTFYNSNVQIWRNTAGTTQYGRFDSSGRLLVGTSSARTDFANSTATPRIQQEATDYNGSSLSLVRNSNNAGNGELIFGKSRGTSLGGVTVVAADDTLGGIRFDGADGTDFATGALISAQVDGTPGTNDMPGRLVFSTTADGASSPTERMRITNAGKVGIGQSTPAAGLDLKSAGQTTAALNTAGDINFLVSDDGSSVGNGGSIVFGFNSGSGRFAAIKGLAISGGGNSTGNLAFSTRNTTTDSTLTERMRIREDGRIVFGATAPTAENELFSFQGNVGTLSMFNVTGGASQCPIRCWNTATSGTRTQILFMDGGGIVRGSITTDGANTAFNTASDYRLKENLELLTGAIQRLSQIPVHRFNFIGSNTKVDGFLAHEVQAVVPQAVVGEKDAVNDDGNPLYQGIDQSKLVPLLTAALQELITEVESLKTEVAVLKAQ